MKYALMLYSEHDHDRSLTPEQTAELRAASMPRWLALFEHMGKVDPDIAGTELDDHRTAKTVRVRDGRRLVTDGPFAETKEQIGGVFITTLPDLDAAIDMASRIPTSEYGTIEIRPLVERT
jgi:hypothetical protein